MIALPGIYFFSIRKNNDEQSLRSHWAIWKARPAKFLIITKNFFGSFFFPALRCTKKTHHFHYPWFITGWRQIEPKKKREEKYAGVWWWPNSSHICRPSIRSKLLTLPEISQSVDRASASFGDDGSNRTYPALEAVPIGRPVCRRLCCAWIPDEWNACAHRRISPW